jgi:excisionase family DNA binding protein
LTTEAAAKKLGISRRRVIALINSGVLQAERFGKSWMIDDNSVKQRIANPVKRGRPLMGDSNSNNFQSYSLMNKNTKICDFIYNTHENMVAKINHFNGDVPAPFGIYSSPNRINSFALTHWIKERCVPSIRPSLPKILLSDNALSPIDLMFKSFGLNLSDQYWFQPSGYDLDWNKINCFDNIFKTTTHTFSNSGIKSLSYSYPDASTPGELDKYWVKDKDGTNYLYKSGSSLDNREPYSEVLAAKLLSRILPKSEYVAYTMTAQDGHIWSVCPSFITTDTELVPAADIFSYFGHSNKDPYQQYRDNCNELGIKNISTALDKMIICDFLMSNPDRHTYNFGLIRDSNTGKFLSSAPLFDNGAAFGSRQNYYDIEHNFPYIAHPFNEYPLTQLGYAKDYSWLNLSALDGFEVEIQNTLSLNSAMDEKIITCISNNFLHNVSTVSDFQKQHQRIRSFSIPNQNHSVRVKPPVHKSGKCR